MRESRDIEYQRLVYEIKNCTKCSLYKNRKNPVPGEGPINTEIVFVGEAPGKSEDEQGRPFVGAAGQLLTQLIEKAGLKRKEVYITNIIKCRPPGNRDPKDDEIEACLPFLLRQLKLIKPKIVVALGRHASRVLLSLSNIEFKSMHKQHGRVYRGSIDSVQFKIMVTYHPAAALYKPPIRRSLEEDFSTIKELVEEVKQSFSTKEKRGLTLLDFFPKNHISSKTKTNDY